MKQQSESAQYKFKLIQSRDLAGLWDKHQILVLFIEGALFTSDKVSEISPVLAEEKERNSAVLSDQQNIGSERREIGTKTTESTSSTLQQRTDFESIWGGRRKKNETAEIRVKAE